MTATAARRTPPRRRSTLLPPMRSRRHRWIIVFGFAGIILVLGIASLLAGGGIFMLLACVSFAFVTCTTQYLAEADVALARLRADAEKRARHAAERDSLLLQTHFARAHDLIRTVWPGKADDLQQSLTLDLLRSRSMTTRLERDAP